MITITYSEIIDFFISCIGYLLIIFAVDFKRPNDKIKTWSREWWIVVVLISIGGIILRNSK